MAIWTRRGQPLDGLIHHSDRGVQFLSIRYTERLATAGAIASVGSKGDSYDNALTESLNGLFKTEVLGEEVPGARSKTSSWRRVSGWTGATTGVFTAPATTSRLQNLRRVTISNTRRSVPPKSKPASLHQTQGGSECCRGWTHSGSIKSSMTIYGGQIDHEAVDSCLCGTRTFAGCGVCGASGPLPGPWPPATPGT